MPDAVAVARKEVAVQTRIRPLSERIPPVKLFLDDVERIVELIGEVSSRVVLETEDYVLQEPGKLAELPSGSIHYLHVSGWEPYITLSLEPNSAYLYAESDTASSRGVCEKVKTLLLTKKRRLSWLTLSSFGPGISAGLAFSGLLWGIVTRQLPLILLGVVCASIAGPWWWWSREGSFRRYSTIVLRRRTDQESFWRRNADRLVVGIIVGTVCTVVGIVVGYLLQVLLRSGQ